MNSASASGGQERTRAPQNSGLQRLASQRQKVQQFTFWSIHRCLQGALGWVKLSLWEYCTMIKSPPPPPPPISAFPKHRKRIFVHSSLPFVNLKCKQANKQTKPKQNQHRKFKLVGLFKFFFFFS